MRRLGLLAASIVGSAPIAAPAAAAPPTPSEPTVQRATTRAPAGGPLRRYLSREVAPSPRYLDHGVLGVAAAGGVPHRYRLELRLGLLDHLTLGATAHWLPRQETPGWSPLVSIAFYRARRFEVGASYHQSLHAPPPLDDDPDTPSFAGRTHWFLGSATFSQSLVAAGFDVGMVRARVLDDVANDDDSRYLVRDQVGGGVHLRVGTRRFGLTLQALAPHFEAEAVLDVRFGLFELRPRGGWLSF